MRYLLIANAYPSDGDIYKYVFVHQRVKYYQEAGLDVSIYRIDISATETADYEYDGVQVRAGNVEGLDAVLSQSKYDTYLVHFPVQYILDSLVRCVPEAKVIVWLHGYETEAWHRRWFDYISQVTRIGSLRRNYIAHKLPFLRALYSGALLDVRFVAVSTWFLKHRIEIDAGMTLVNPNVIPNYIDTEFFETSGKSADMRFNVLSIRPFSSKKYANDLTVGAILALREHPLWDQLRFTICGDGPDFDSTVEPLCSLENVTVKKGFLTREAIRDLHRVNGVFLAPTRFDSQGVSTCEAMSSGLVPVSTNITAVPEFVEHGVSGMLAQPEDPRSLADAVSHLVENPDTYVQLSLGAASGVRESVCAEMTVQKEIRLITDQTAGRGQDFGPVMWASAYEDVLLEAGNLVSHIEFRSLGLEAD